MSRKPPFAREIFSRAIEVPPRERSELLDRECSGDRELRLRVEKLLKAHEEATGFLDAPTFERPPPDLFPTDGEGPSPASADSAGAAVPGQDGGSVGPFERLEKLGEGGMGEVYVAEQRKPVRRRVAVKLIKLGMDTRDVVARFEAERQALALMNHAHIAKIHDAGITADGRPYFAMEYVPGRHVTEYCDREKLPVRERLKIFLEVCDAVQHAHQKGIIHRDLKPSNVLVSVQDGRALPKIIDFGVAKATNQRLTERTLYTQQGMLVGTPTYMSPEQAEGAQDIDTRTDIYSLGVILYELLVGALPYDFDDSSYEGIQRTIREKETPKPSTRLGQTGDKRGTIADRRQADVRSLSRQLRGDLDWITLKAMEKDRTRRYASASEFAADISRYLAGEPVLARRPSAGYRLRKFVARNKSLAAAAALLVGGVIAVLVVQQLARARVERLADELRRELYAAEVNIAFKRLSENNLAQARELTEAQRPAPGEADLRGWEWRYLWSLCRSDEVETFRDGTAHGIAFSFDGQHLAYVGGGRIHFRDLRSGQTVLRRHESATLVSFSPLDHLLAVSGDPEGGRGVKVWDTRTWTERYYNAEECSPARFSPDGRWLAASAREKVTLRETDRWRIIGEQPTRPLNWHWRHVLTFSPDSRLLLVPDGGQHCKLLRVPSLEELPPPDLGGKSAESAAFSADGRTLLLGLSDGWIMAWDVREERVLDSFPAHDARVSAIAVAPDGLNFATASDDQTIRLWGASDFQPLVRLRGHDNQVFSLAYSPDGEHLATGSFDETVKLWSTRTRHGGETFPGLLHALGTSSGNPTLVVSDSGALILHDLDGNHETRWRIEDLGFERWQVSASLEVLAGVLRSNLGRVEIWSLRERKKQRAIDTGLDHVELLAFSRDESSLAIGGEMTASLWDLESGSKLAQFVHEGKVNNVDLAPDGRTLATSTEVPAQHPVRVWDLASDQEIARSDGNRNLAFAMAYSPDSRLVATGTADALVNLLTVSSNTKRVLAGHVAEIVGVEFSPDGRTLASIDRVGKLKLWSVTTGRELVTLDLDGEANWPYPCAVPVRFSPDGRRLAAPEKSDQGARVRLWTVPSLEDIDRAASRSP